MKLTRRHRPAGRQHELGRRFPHHARNYGWGKQMHYAARNTLRARYGCPHYATEAAHVERIKPFIAFARARGVNCWTRVDVALVRAYGEALRAHLQAGELAQRTCISRLSTVNVVLAALRDDRKVWLSPRELFGRRVNVRTEPPIGLDLKKVLAFADDLRAAGHPRIAAAVEFARLFGMRFRETALAPVHVCLRRARRDGVIDIRLGTKGGRGRNVERLVPVGPKGMATLERACRLVGRANRNIIPADWIYERWYNHAHEVLRRHAPRYGLSTKFHDLRAAYVCTRYSEETDHPAPVVSGRRAAPANVHHQAAGILTREMGHGRADVLTSYYGSTRVRRES